MFGPETDFLIAPVTSKLTATAHRFLLNDAMCYPTRAVCCVHRAVVGRPVKATGFSTGSPGLKSQSAGKLVNKMRFGFPHIAV